MHRRPLPLCVRRIVAFQRALSRDARGNTLAIIAGALIPIIALVGGAVDVSRGYLAQSRLQQACDAGTLAARKALGSRAPAAMPADVQSRGARFFNANFRDGAFGTSGRNFAMTLESDFAISGTADLVVPTTLMKVIGFQEMPVRVTCQARLNFSNTDVMMVLDTTGSMNWTNAGDTQTRIQAMRAVVKSFHAQLETSKQPGNRIRYGFVPYSTNVNVAGLLRSDWFVDTWQYEGRTKERSATGTTYSITYSEVSGVRSPITRYYASACPADTARWETVSRSENDDGEYVARKTVSGDDYHCQQADMSGFWVSGDRYAAYVFDEFGVPDNNTWRYKTISNVDVTSLKGANGAAPMAVNSSISLPMGGSPNAVQAFTGRFAGCIEERGTYQIVDYDNVDFTRALDLNLDYVPQKGVPATQWRPLIPAFSFVRSLDWNGVGSIGPDESLFPWDYVNSDWGGYAACPSPAVNLDEMDRAQVSTYLDSLVAAGSTYHDIGMIWGGRILSPTGIFSARNSDINGVATSRHLIFLTDGETAPLDLSYGSYGIEPISQRRWSKSSGLTLTQTVEKRFGVACEEVKKRNVTVWIIGFGTTLNPVMTQCAGAGRFFEASNASQLEDAFTKIASAVGDLRLAR